MEERINKRLFTMGLLSLLLTAVALTIVFQTTYDRQVKGDLRQDAEMVAAVYENTGVMDSILDVTDLRLTLIAADGEVLFETATDTAGMTNHLERPEVQQALAAGSGEATRRSQTVGYKTCYYALRLSDGNVLRAAREVVSMYASFDRMLLIIFVLILVVLAGSVVLSTLLTKNLVKPIENMAKNLDQIDEHIPYPELEPFARKIKEQQVRTRENERMRREFTANVSHELKTPLTSISGYAEMIENGMAKPEDVKDFAGKIHNEAGRLISVIGDIIQLGEIEEPGEVEMTRVNIAEIAGETVDSLSFTAERAGVHLAFAGRSDCYIEGNRDMLGELMYNLCDNAIRYNRQGGTVQVTTAADDSFVVLTVSDTGIGIPSEFQQRIFERFYRVDRSRSKQTGGTGLGLAIVKHIAIKHGADIDVDSAEGKGTTIHVTFRAWQEPAAPSSAD